METYVSKIGMDKQIQATGTIRYISNVAAAITKTKSCRRASLLLRLLAGPQKEHTSWITEIVNKFSVNANVEIIRSTQAQSETLKLGVQPNTISRYVITLRQGFEFGYVLTDYKTCLT